jgi:hypothetical protein
LTVSPRRALSAYLGFMGLGLVSIVLVLVGSPARAHEGHDHAGTSTVATAPPVAPVDIRTSDLAWNRAAPQVPQATSPCPRDDGGCCCRVDERVPGQRVRTLALPPAAVALPYAAGCDPDIVESADPPRPIASLLRVCYARAPPAFLQ